MEQEEEDRMNKVGEIEAIRSTDARDEEEEDEQRALDEFFVRLPPFGPVPQKKMDVPGLRQTCSAVAWCGKSHIIACATKICVREAGYDEHPAFWIPVHVIDPDGQCGHTPLTVTAESPYDAVEFLEFSPVGCSRALLVGTSSGRVSVWCQPTTISSRANTYHCEHEWRQEQAVRIKWLAGPPSYGFSSTPPMSAPSSKSLEERFPAHIPVTAVPWPYFLCFCSITYSGSVQLYWRQLRPAQTGRSRSPTWSSTSKVALEAGPGGLLASDAIITATGNFLVAGTPVGSRSTVIVWEISPGVVNQSGGNRRPSDYGVPLQTRLRPPLAAYLQSWQGDSSRNTKLPQWARVENDEKPGPVLHCSPVSNFSAYVAPDSSTSTTWGSQVAVITFDPSWGGSALMTMIREGYFTYPGCPDNGPYHTGWRLQRWESSRQPVAIHPLFGGSGAYPEPANITSWTAVSSKTITRKINVCTPIENGAWKEFHALHRPNTPTCVAKILFYAHGGQFAISIATGEVYVFPASSMIPTESFVAHTGLSYPPGVAFSPTSCCVALAWHNKKEDCSVLKIACLEPFSSPAGPGGVAVSSTWERHLADRFWWCLLNKLDWWDIIACARFADEEGIVTTTKVAAVLDADFHALPNPLPHQHYSSELDAIKCRLLEGRGGAEMVALVKDMQRRVLVDRLGMKVDAALTDPSTLVAEPFWLPCSACEVLSRFRPDAMAVDSALVPGIQATVDSILELASLFVTRLRHYASYQTISASDSVGNSSCDKFSRPGVNSNNRGITQTGRGAASQTDSGNSIQGTAAGVNAWTQPAGVKTNTSAKSATANAASSGTAQADPSPQTISAATFPAARLTGDPQFCHRLCQLLLFCFIFRKRHPRFIAGPRIPADITPAPQKVGGVASHSADHSRFSTVGVATSSNGAPSRQSEETTNPQSGPVGNGNAGQGYISEGVEKFLFEVLVDLCRKIAMHPHRKLKSQVGITQPIMRLHRADGQHSVPPELVGESFQTRPLSRTHADPAVRFLIERKFLREQKPAEQCSFGPRATHLHLGSVISEEYQTPFRLWPRKRKQAERDAARAPAEFMGSTRLG